MKTLTFAFFLLISFSLNAQQPKPFSIGKIEAQPGEKAGGKLIIEKGVDQGTFIPITIINGVKPGPVLTLSAGLHGTEYVPVITLQKLINKIDPAQLSGTLVLIHVANVLAFHSYTVYSNPIDNKNLNRCFPGKKDGTLSERIAFTISNEILKKSDYFIDLHGGEFIEQIIDYVYYNHGCKESDLCKKSKMLAQALGNKYFIPEHYSSYPDSIPSTYSEAEAFRLGVAAVTNEWGDLGVVKPDELATALKGVLNAIRTIGMLDGETFKNEHPLYLVNLKETKSKYDGILYTFADKGQYVTKGTLIGYTTDYWGKTLEKYYSPISGIIVYIKVSPAIQNGTGIFSVAEVKENYN